MTGIPTIEERLLRIEAQLSVLLDREAPVITFAEIHRKLGYKSPNSTRQWIKDHKLAKVAPCKYRQLDFVNASTGRAA